MFARSHFQIKNLIAGVLSSQTIVLKWIKNHYYHGLGASRYGDIFSTKTAGGRKKLKTANLSFQVGIVDFCGLFNDI